MEHRKRPLRMRARRLSWWRLFAAAPGMLAGAAVVWCGLAWAGRWAIFAFAVWVFTGFVLLGRAGERVGVRVAFRCRGLSRRQRAAWSPVLGAAARSCGVDEGAFDWYIHRSARPNAFAAGRHAVIVTSGLVEKIPTNQVSSRNLHAVVAHELGHHVTGADRFGLAVWWWSLPWRAVWRGLVLLVAVAAWRYPRRLAVTLLVAVMAVAAVRSVLAGQWAAAGVLAGLLVAGGVMPLVHAALSRACERAADGFVARVGAGEALAAALRELAGPDGGAGWWQTMTADHPPIAERVAALTVSSTSST